MSMRVEMLGVSRVIHSGGEHLLKPTIRDQALAYLAYSNDWVTRDRLGFLFWADSPDATARHNVRQLLKRGRLAPTARAGLLDAAATRRRSYRHHLLTTTVYSAYASEVEPIYLESEYEALLECYQAVSDANGGTYGCSSGPAVTQHPKMGA